MIGRRLPDTPWGKIPDGVKHGDVWKYLDRETGEPMSSKAHQRTFAPDAGTVVEGNLTDCIWGYYSPDGNGIGTLVYHTVREEDDGTISVRPGDGSSNSILHEGGATHRIWHGYIEHNIWNAC